MKYLSILIILVFGMSQTSFAQADAISKYFDHYMEDERFTVVYISARMFDMFSSVEIEGDDEMLEVISGLRGLRILTSEENGETYYKEAINLIDVEEYELLMTVRDKEQNVRFFIKNGSDGRIDELLLLVGGEDFVLMSFVGDIDLKKISKLANNMDMKGIEHLEKIDR